MSQAQTASPQGLRAYILTYAALLALATASLALSSLQGSLALWVALAIATFKAVLVLLFFMHLREEPFAARFAMTVGTLLVGIFISLTVLDPLTRGPSAPLPSAAHSGDVPSGD